MNIQSGSELQNYLLRFNDADLLVRAGEILGSQKLRLSLDESVEIICYWFRKEEAQ